MWEQLLSFSFFTMLLALSPGPDNIFVLTQSLVNGSKKGIATTAGLISGCIVHTTFLAFGVSVIIAASPTAILVIKIIGAVYLLYLAIKVFRSDDHIDLSQNVSSKSNWELFKIGVIMNLVNPKVLLFFLAFFPSFLWNPDDDTVLQFYVLGIVFMMVSFIIFSSIALLAGGISSFILKHKKAGFYLKWLQIFVFLGIAVFILFA
ncbi:LysE family translocator [Aureisphaera sp. CAU 1614]|uniref:LysE family translocator n=1 Tax=Halomarinibacterium sedimenti TaxID=2857106 RepID=A0A9X1JVD2_9FLAO|nr:LysE family translocator [Halomarinibacterium sedimenti]MBW2937595.1 LysE family translocator [Halomarinibacterium sedimenti]